MRIYKYTLHTRYHKRKCSRLGYRNNNMYKSQSYKLLFRLFIRGPIFVTYHNWLAHKAGLWTYVITKWLFFKGSAHEMILVFCRFSYDWNEARRPQRTKYVLFLYPVLNSYWPLTAVIFQVSYNEIKFFHYKMKRKSNSYGKVRSQTEQFFCSRIDLLKLYNK